MLLVKKRPSSFKSWVSCVFPAKDHQPTCGGSKQPRCTLAIGHRPLFTQRHLIFTVINQPILINRFEVTIVNQPFQNFYFQQHSLTNRCSPMLVTFDTGHGPPCTVHRPNFWTSKIIDSLITANLTLHQWFTTHRA